MNRRVVAAQFLPHLPDGFHEGQRLDVAHRAANFDDGDIHILRHLLHRSLDFIGDVRNHLHGFTQIIAAPLLGDDLFVDSPGGPVVIARKFGVGEAFVVAQVEIGLCPVVGDEDLAMLERRHGARIDVEVRIELHQVDLQPAALQQAANRGRRQSLAQ